MMVRRLSYIFPCFFFKIVSAVECGIAYFTLIDSQTQQDISVLPDTINVKEFPLGAGFNIRADFYPCAQQYRSVLLRFTSNGELSRTYCDEEPPFTAFGDHTLDDVSGKGSWSIHYIDHALVKSNCTVTAIPFAERNCQGRRGKSFRRSFEITEKNMEKESRFRDMMEGKRVQCSVGAISVLQLVSGDGEVLVESRKHETPISIAHGGNYSLRALPKPCSNGSIRSIEFKVHVGDQKFVEKVNKEPYQIPLPEIVHNGPAVLVATPFSRNEAQGDAGEAQRIKFSIGTYSYRSNQAVSGVCSVGQVTSLFLVSEDMKIIDEIQENKVLCIPTKSNYSIRAMATPCTTKSMRSVRLVLRIGDQQFIEKEEVNPYTLQLPSITKNSTAVILATPFSEKNGKGFAGITKRIPFTVAPCREQCTIGDVTGFQLISEAGEVISTIKESVPACIPDKSQYSIRAITKPCSKDSIKSVKLVLRLDGRVTVRNENIDPYTIELPAVTDNTTVTVMATPFGQSNARGEAGTAAMVRFPVTPCPVRSPSDCRVVRFLYEGDKLKKRNSVCFVNKPVVIEAVVHCENGQKASKIVFEMKGPKEIIDTQYSKPYTLQGPAGIDLPRGSYKLEAIPYGASVAGESLSIRISVVDCSPTKAPTVSPPTPGDSLCAERSGATNPDGFQICLDLLNVPKSDMLLFKSVSDHWSRVISSDLPDAPSKSFGASWACTEYPETIDDLYICGKYEELDGPGNVLGVGNYMYQRVGSRLPATGYMSFDVADVDALRKNATLEPLLLHEMGHVLGLGTMWDDVHLADNCVYSGQHANREWQDISKCAGASVPLGRSERLCRHWDELCLRDELMTGFFRGENRPILSKITVGGLEDLGYDVDYSEAEEFTSKNVDPSCLCERQLYETSTEWKNANRPGLSKEGLEKARETGRRQLSRMAPPFNRFAEDVEFVAHQQVSVLYMEGNDVFHVLVTNRDF